MNSVKSIALATLSFVALASTSVFATEVPSTTSADKLSTEVSGVCAPWVRRCISTPRF